MMQNNLLPVLEYSIVEINDQLFISNALMHCRYVPGKDAFYNIEIKNNVNRYRKTLVGDVESGTDCAYAFIQQNNSKIGISAIFSALNIDSCTFCGGQGFVCLCERCNGSGTTQQAVSGFGCDNSDCGQCNGSGQVTHSNLHCNCVVCGGTGLPQ